MLNTFKNISTKSTGRIRRGGPGHGTSDSEVFFFEWHSDGGEGMGMIIFDSLFWHMTYVFLVMMVMMVCCDYHHDDDDNDDDDEWCWWLLIMMLMMMTTMMIYDDNWWWWCWCKSICLLFLMAGTGRLWLAAQRTGLSSFQAAALRDTAGSRWSKCRWMRWI